MFKWNKMGLIFNPKDTGLSWMVHHAANPVVIQLKGSIWRCFFAGRNAENISSAGYFDIDLNTPNKVLHIAEQPVLQSGPIGTFDYDGIYPSSIINIGNMLYMYYIGWNKGGDYPLFHASIGLAVSKDGGDTFEKYSKAPIFDRNDKDPITVTAPYVYSVGGCLVMNYTSIERWENVNGQFYSWYYRKYTTSSDAIHWEVSDKTAIPLKDGEDHIARMCVLRIDDQYEGWYSYTKKVDGQYKIGYSVSDDGIKWVRKDEEAGMVLSDTGWDSEAQAYPYVIRWNGKRYMFYNGNHNGFDGVGLAIEA